MNTEDLNENNSGSASGAAGSSGADSVKGPAEPVEYPSSPQSQTEPETGPRLVECVTGLRGQAISRTRVPARTIRKNTEDELKEKDPEVPLLKAEKSLHDLGCSLMERQDRMNEEILLRVIDLQYRMDDLEADFAGLKRKKGTGNSGATP